MVFGAIVSFFGVHFLHLTAIKLRHENTTFTNISNDIFPQFTPWIDFTIFVQSSCTTLSYFIIVGQSLPKAFEQMELSPFFTSRTNCVILYWLLVIPLSGFPKLQEVKITTIISAVTISIIALVIVLYASGSDGILDPCANLEDDTICDGTTHVDISGYNGLQAMPIILFSFCCQQNAFTIYSELNNPTQWRLDTISAAAMLTCCLLFVIVSCAGYSTYGDKLEADILEMYPENSLTSACRLMLSFICCAHFPLQFNPVSFHGFISPVIDCIFLFFYSLFPFSFLHLHFPPSFLASI